jgi:hypothetical protein
MPITMGLYYLTHPVNFTCGRKPVSLMETHDFVQNVDLTENRTTTLEVKGEWFNHFATKAPIKQF